MSKSMLNINDLENLNKQIEELQMKLEKSEAK